MLSPGYFFWRVLGPPKICASGRKPSIRFLLSNFSRAEIGKVGDSTEVSVSRRVFARGGSAVVTGNIAQASYRELRLPWIHKMIERLKKKDRSLVVKTATGFDARFALLLRYTRGVT